MGYWHTKKRRGGITRNLNDKDNNFGIKQCLGIQGMIKTYMFYFNEY